MSILLGVAALTATAIAQSSSCPAGSLPANQRLEWTPCPVNAYGEDGQPYYAPTLECSTIDVPLDYTNSGSEILTLPLVRVPSNSSTPLNRTIIFNPGGPGASGIDSLIGFADDLQAVSGGGYHLVSFDPRGVGLTYPYLCPIADVAIPYSSRPITDPNGLNATYYANAIQGELCAQSPYAEQGQFLGTAFVARDIDAIAQAIGEDGRIRYWGMSYGTLLGSTIAAMFPDKIDRMVLDGNINPTDYYHGLGDEAADDVDRELAFFFDSCAQAGPDYCPLSGPQSTGPVLQAVFYDFLNGINNGTYALRDRNGVRISYKRIKSSLFSYLYSAANFPDLAASIFNLYLATQPGTSSTSGKRQEQQEFNVTERLGLAQYPNVLTAITCGEWDEIPAGDLNDFRELVSIYEERSTFGGDQLIGIVFACATWNVTARERFGGEFQNIRTGAPILFVNSDKDPVTPLISAQNSSSGFVDSRVLQHTGAGHCSTAHPSNCVQEKIRSYWQTGTIPDVSEICQPNVANPLVEDVRTPINVTDRTNQTTTNEDEERFSRAVSHLADLLGSSKTSSFEFPTEILERAKTKRSISAPLFGRQATASASCTSMTAVPSSPPITGGSSSSATSAAGRLPTASGGLVLSVLLGALCIFM
ncbi:hypothetical protein LTR64_008174 [Lithohypha guttulata]|uniref:uncharacterized protein n=1 Tax=Lithohypha guttulata TaxID=1690604 RepID=UPI002DDF17B4|nr:hypothetical protein LTR51_008326 [Lithohypha guttulata]